MTKQFEKATFGAGCFWGVEAAFQKLKGIKHTTVGYMGGHLKNPTYEDVCTDQTGHAEVVQIEYDPDEISYLDLLDTFWKLHDPTALNRQGPDVGTQYRSVIFYHTEEQQQTAIQSIENLNKSHQYANPVVTEVQPAKDFYKAEDYHQNYYQKKGLASCKI